MKKIIKIFLLIVIFMIVVFIINTIISTIVTRINNTSKYNTDEDVYVDTGYNYNSFSDYLGENKSAVAVKYLITSIKTENIITNNYNSINQTEEREKIECYFNGELLDETSIQNKISNKHTYKVEAEYNDEGVLSKIIIEEN